MAYIGIDPNVGDITFQKFTGDGSTTAFTVTADTAVANVLVSVEGVLMLPTTDYTISGTTLTFATAPANGAEIAFRYLPLGT